MTRFERHGGPPDLPTAFGAFVAGPLQGRSLDDNAAQEGAEGQFPDFAAFRDLVLIEMKHLETDQQDRLNAVVEQKADQAEMPLFYGTRDGGDVLDKLSNRDEVRFALFSKLSRGIEGVLSKANRQFESYRRRHPRKNALNICLLLNASQMEYTPEVVGRAVYAKIRGSKGEDLRFPHIDAVVYISEKHFRQLPDGRLAFAILVMEAVGAIDHGWKMPIVHLIVAAWADFRTGVPSEKQGDLRGFEIVEDIPARMRRHQLWQLEYRRNPYLKSLTLAELRTQFHRQVALGSLFLLKGDWPKPPVEERTEGMRRYQHLLEETNRRGTDVRDLDMRLLTAEESETVFDGLPSALIAILSRERSEPNSPR